MTTTILYYTNNLIPKELLRNTLTEVFSNITSEDRELIITSHFPLTTRYTQVDLSDGKEERMYVGKINLETKEARLANIYKHLAKDLNVDLGKTNYQEYVVGKLPYVYRSIFKQLVFSLEKANGENIVFMEHDCFYPCGYVSAVEEGLKNADFCYCQKRHCYLDFEGYFRTSVRFLLSGCSGKRDLLLRVFKKKLELLNMGQSYYFEPLLDVADDETKARYSGEEFISKHFCLDGFLSGDMLDIKHRLNQGGQLNQLRNYPGALKIGALKEYEALENHPYWGSPDRFLKMIDIDIDRTTEEECKLGVGFY